MKTLEDIQEEYASEIKQPLFVILNTTIHWKVCCNRFAIEVSRAALENAAKNVETETVNLCRDISQCGNAHCLYHGCEAGMIEVKKSSITDERNIPKI